VIGDDALGVVFREGAGMGMEMERGHSRRIEVHTSVRRRGGGLWLLDVLSACLFHTRAIHRCPPGH
jgi:hypothetical protein